MLCELGAKGDPTLGGWRLEVAEQSKAGFRFNLWMDPPGPDARVHLKCSGCNMRRVCQWDPEVPYSVPNGIVDQLLHSDDCY